MRIPAVLVLAALAACERRPPPAPPSQETSNRALQAAAAALAPPSDAQEEAKRGSDAIRALEQMQQADFDAWSKTKAGKICDRHHEWQRQECERLAKREVWVGMDAAQARVAHGPPDSVNETVTANSRREQWAYPNGDYLYFEGGHLTSMQLRR